MEDIFANFPIAVWFPLAILAFYAQIQFVKKWSWEKIPYDVPFPSAILTNIIFLAVLYGVQFYFYLPPSLGGGLPTPVTLLVDTNKVEAAKQLLPITSQNPSVTVFLIEQTNDSLYVLVDNQPDANHMLYPVQIDKSIIVGAIYPKKIKPSGRLDFGNIRSTSTSVPTLTPTETSIP